ncbi:hypothetical protein [Prauserella flavalba]|uniref:Aconitate hydratase n=1 Tax=Prauserella flavalba TaxID=1477506 RepID=A0A318LVF8_9PSEU|nr:hypothetical protein [Prauserella flavalba]PXY36427.1 hypothetical protein BA062_13590 [Prauserella flavalba]
MGRRVPGENAGTLGLTGAEPFTVTGLTALAEGRVPEHVTVRAGDVEFRVRVRLDTAREADYYRHGGIMNYVLREIVEIASADRAW